MRFLHLFLLCFSTAHLIGGDSPTNTAPAAIQLYALDGGGLTLTDMKPLAQDDSYAGRTITMAIPAFLIRHPKGDLLWDLGMPDSLADQPDGLKGAGFHYWMNHKIEDQLKQLQLKPADIEYVAVSHGHSDHIGNGNLFGEAALIIHQKEHAELFSVGKLAEPEAQDTYAALKNANTLLVTDQFDVFGDGTVLIYASPGHTDGHMVLLVRLAKNGYLLLSGDLYTHAEARTKQTVPVFNRDAEATVTSRARFEALAEKHQARVVIQHDLKHFQALPRFPLFLD